LAKIYSIFLFSRRTNTRVLREYFKAETSQRIQCGTQHMPGGQGEDYYYRIFYNALANPQHTDINCREGKINVCENSSSKSLWHEQRQKNVFRVRAVFEHFTGRWEMGVAGQGAEG